MSLIQKLGEPRRPENLEGDASDPVAALERLQPFLRAVEEIPGAVGGRERGIIKRIDDVVSGIPSLDFIDGVFRNFFRRHKFHLAGRRDRLELASRKKSVLTRI